MKDTKYLYYGGIVPEDTINGPGVRVSLFVSGCGNKCKGCFNKEARNPYFGKMFNREAYNELIAYMKNPMVSGLTLLGGDPCYTKNVDKVLNLVLAFKDRMTKENMENKINIWMYTGYLFETLLNGRTIKRFETRKLIKNVDVVVDGPFVLELRDIGLKFRGSSNQRIIDVKRSLKEDKVILWKDGDY